LGIYRASPSQPRQRATGARSGLACRLEDAPELVRHLIRELFYLLKNLDKYSAFLFVNGRFRLVSACDLPLEVAASKWGRIPFKPLGKEILGAGVAKRLATITTEDEG
jgi:hypothetical protein